MKAVILAGGEGTRMRPLTKNLHKAMLPLLNRPIMEFILDYLKGEGITEVIIALSYRPQDVSDYFGDGQKFGLKISYVLETTPLGTSGAVKNASSYLDEQPFCVLNGDIFYRINLRRMLEKHLQNKAVASIALTRVEDPRAYGLVKMDGKGRILEFLEKPSGDGIASGMINAGIYIISPQALNLVPEGKFYMFEKGLFPELIRRGEKMYGFPTSSYWIDVGTPENYLKVHRDLLLSKELKRERLVKEAVNWNREACDIHPDAMLTGPVVLAEGCTIGRGSRIQGPASIGKNCNIGNDTAIENSIIWHGVRIEEGISIKSSIIASWCMIEKGAVLNEGCILGDGVRVTEGKVLPSGTRIPPE